MMRNLLWILVAATLFCLATGDASPGQTGNASQLKSTKSDGRTTAHKYTEVEDLNTFESAAVSAARYTSSDEADSLDDEEPKKLVKRSTSTENKVQKGRPSRQNPPKKQRPGFFWTIARVTYETFNETKSAFQQIGKIVGDNFPTESPRKKAAPKKKPTTAKPVTVSSSDQKAGLTSVTTEEPVTTTKFTITRPELQSLVRRNVKGLVRLFNIEWADAMKESQQSIRDFQRDLGKQIGGYLKDNPDNY